MYRKSKAFSKIDRVLYSFWHNNLKKYGLHWCSKTATSSFGALLTYPLSHIICTKQPNTKFLIIRQFESNGAIRIIKTVSLTYRTNSVKIGSVRCEFCHHTKTVTTIVDFFSASEAETRNQRVLFLKVVHTLRAIKKNFTTLTHKNTNIHSFLFFAIPWKECTWDFRKLSQKLWKNKCQNLRKAKLLFLANKFAVFDRTSEANKKIIQVCLIGIKATFLTIQISYHSLLAASVKRTLLLYFETSHKQWTMYLLISLLIFQKGEFYKNCQIIKSVVEISKLILWIRNNSHRTKIFRYGNCRIVILKGKLTQSFRKTATRLELNFLITSKFGKTIN